MEEERERAAEVGEERDVCMGVIKRRLTHPLLSFLNYHCHYFSRFSIQFLFIFLTPFYSKNTNNFNLCPIPKQYYSVFVCMYVCREKHDAPFLLIGYH